MAHSKYKLFVLCHVCGHLYLYVQVSKFEVEEATRETSKAQVRAEACGTSQQGVGVHTWTLKVCHPCLLKTWSVSFN